MDNAKTSPEGQSKRAGAQQKATTRKAHKAAQPNRMPAARRSSRNNALAIERCGPSGRNQIHDEASTRPKQPQRRPQRIRKPCTESLAQRPPTQMAGSKMPQVAKTHWPMALPAIKLPGSTASLAVRPPLRTAHETTWQVAGNEKNNPKANQRAHHQEIRHGLTDLRLSREGQHQP